MSLIHKQALGNAASDGGRTPAICLLTHASATSRLTVAVFMDLPTTAHNLQRGYGHAYVGHASLLFVCTKTALRMKGCLVSEINFYAPRNPPSIVMVLMRVRLVAKYDIILMITNY